MKKFILSIAVVLTTLVASHAERLHYDYMGNGVAAYFNNQGYARGYAVNNPYGLSFYDEYGRYIGHSIYRGTYAYVYNTYGWLIGRVRIR
jgi:hypothetical protein